MYPWLKFVEDGGLMTYTASRTDLIRGAAHCVDTVLKGAKAAACQASNQSLSSLLI